MQPNFLFGFQCLKNPSKPWFKRREFNYLTYPTILLNLINKTYPNLSADISTFQKQRNKNRRSKLLSQVSVADKTPGPNVEH